MKATRTVRFSPGSGLILVCAAGVIWGTIGAAVQVIHDRSGLSPLSISAYRALVAAAVLALACGAAGRWAAARRLVREHRGRVLVVGALTAAFQLFFFIAVVATGVSVATVVCLGFAPVLLLAVTSAQRRRWPSPPEVGTVMVALTGLLLVVLAGGGVATPAHPVLGICAALASGAAYALSAEVVAPLSRANDTLAVTTATMLVAAGILTPGGLALAATRSEPLTTSDASSWLLIVHLGVMTMAVGYALLFAGLRSTSSGAAVVATLVEPVTAVAIAVAFLGEALTPAGVIGSLLILAAIASLGRSPQEPPPQ